MTRVRQPLFMPSCSGEQVVLAPRLRRDAGEELLAAAHGAQDARALANGLERRRRVEHEEARVLPRRET